MKRQEVEASTLRGISARCLCRAAVKTCDLWRSVEIGDVSMKFSRPVTSYCQNLSDLLKESRSTLLWPGLLGSRMHIRRWVDWCRLFPLFPGACLATELKNNAFKLGRWTAQARNLRVPLALEHAPVMSRQRAVAQILLFKWNDMKSVDHTVSRLLIVYRQSVLF